MKLVLLLPWIVLLLAAPNMSAANSLGAGSLKLVRHGADKPWELYDLANDVGESKNLAVTRAGDVARLNAAYQTWLADVKLDASPPAPRPARTKKK
jgi:hypothetical protein